MSGEERRIYEDLVFLYGEESAQVYAPRLLNRLAAFRSEHPDLAAASSKDRFSERDAILISYGDMVSAPGEASLRTLANFLKKHVGGAISGVHLLPFFPFSSDDGFSVVDYKKVDSLLGAWSDIAHMGESYRLMFDAVVNHISAKSEWFRAFLRDDPAYRHHFLEITPDMDVSRVFRPRALPLETAVLTPSGQKTVWTTFSADQVDLNYRSPQLLLDVLDVLLTYVDKGAEFIRLDAIAFIWKESGTNCLHLPQTHRIIQLMRKVLDSVAPGVSIITETNVPHQDNISYFGDGFNEAQMVYNFSLPPLTLHAFQTGNAEALSEWADTLNLPSSQTTFFNFLASHDGIGVTPARGFLPDEAIVAMGKRVENLGGYVSNKSNPDGSRSPYELNINYLDALGDPEVKNEPIATLAQRFLASQAIMLALRGVPGIYFHSLFGSRSWPQGAQQTGRHRTINRQKLSLSQIEKDLFDTTSLRYQVFQGYLNMLKQRITNAAFHPTGEQSVLFCNKSVFALRRIALDGVRQVICLHNLSNLTTRVEIAAKDISTPDGNVLVDLLGGRRVKIGNGVLALELRPYEVLWLA
ncbi:alpha-amylase family glycosyl hydrolase [Chloroflexota bacterium]